MNRCTATGYSRLVTASWVNRVRAHFLCKCGYEELSLVDGILTAIATPAAHADSAGGLPGGLLPLSLSASEALSLAGVAAASIKSNS